MAFVLSKSVTYKWPVILEMPVDGGRFKKERFTVIFRRLPQSRIDEILLLGQKLRRVAQEGMPETEDLLSEVRVTLREMIAGWEGVKQSDDDLDDLEFTEENLSAFLDFQGVGGAILEAFGESLQLSKAKN